MKRFILTCFATLCLANQTYSQAPKGNMDALKLKIESLLAKAESKHNNALGLNRILQQLDDNSLYYVDKKTQRAAIIRLRRVYELIPNEVSTNSANKKRIIGIVGLCNNGPEAHSFILSVLENGSEAMREAALSIIYFRVINGDDIYDKIKNLIARGLIKQENAFSALKGANPRRAAREIQDFLATTKDPEQFVRKGSLLSEYGDPALMDVVVDRYDYFKNLPSSKKQHRYDPTLSFKIDVLKRYLEQKEGKLLKKALEIFSDSGVFGESKLPIISKKIGSQDSISREAAADFLVRQLEIGSVSKEKVLPLLREAATRETHPTLKLKLKRLIDKHERPAGGKTK